MKEHTGFHFIYIIPESIKSCTQDVFFNKMCVFKLLSNSVIDNIIIVVYTTLEYWTHFTFFFSTKKIKAAGVKLFMFFFTEDFCAPSRNQFIHPTRGK